MKEKTDRDLIGFVKAHYGKIGALVLLVAGVGLRVFRPVTVDMWRVERGTVTEEVFGRGTIESQREAALGFDLVGRVSEVLVDEGTKVTLGQEVARLETGQALADFRSAQTGVAAARSSLQRLSAEEDRARSVLVSAERDASRVQALFETGSATGQQRDDANDRLRVARADLNRVLASRSEATRGIDVASGGAEQRRVAMVRATLLAPFEGIVTRRLREPGDTVVVWSTVLRLADTAKFYVAASIDETVLPKLAVDQVSQILFPNSSSALRGKVSRIPWEADRQTHERLVDVLPEKTDRRIAIGQRADVRIELARKDNVLRIQTKAIRWDSRGHSVYVGRSGRIAVARVKLGVVGDSLAEVTEGLSEQDVVLTPIGEEKELPVGRRWVAL